MATPPSVVEDALEHDMSKVFSMSDETGQRPGPAMRPCREMCMMMGQKKAFQKVQKTRRNFFCSS